MHVLFTTYHLPLPTHDYYFTRRTSTRVSTRWSLPCSYYVPTTTYQAHINESKYEMERVTRELQEVKRKYYEQKRREALAKARHGVA